MSNLQTQTQASTSTPGPVLAPPVDVYENDDEYRLVADLPGVVPDDVTLDLDRGELTLLAKRTLAREGEGLALGRREGEFRRVFKVPELVDPTTIEASFEQGVLQIRMPKHERVKPRRITISAP